VRVIGSAYAGIATLAAPALRLWLKRRVRRGKEWPERLPEREGIDTAPRPAGRLLWLHAASVGETVSVLPVLAALAGAAADVSVLMTTGTVTSADLLLRRLEEMNLDHRVRHRFVPLDVPAWAGRFLDHWRPDAAGFVESEVWPNLLHACAHRHIPVLLVNARLSARSFARWRRVPGLARAIFGGFAGVLAQSPADGERLAALGARDVSAPGNLKFAGLPLPAPAGELGRLRDLLAGRPVWLAASTHPGEDAQVLRAHDELALRHPHLLTVIVPRHPERGAGVAALAVPRPVTRRSRGEPPPAASGVWVADTLGELGLLYAAIGIVFVGGSLVPHGGQNVLEPARQGCAIATGPHTHNFAEPVAALAEAGALSVVAGAAGLAAWAGAMLDDPQARADAGHAGRLAASRHNALPGQVAASLLALLPPGPA
jgi:3-deoxy-D-manno-octulosonic-acid transferase